MCLFFFALFDTDEKTFLVINRSDECMHFLAWIGAMLSNNSVKRIISSFYTNRVLNDAREVLSFLLIVSKNAGYEGSTLSHSFIWTDVLVNFILFVVEELDEKLFDLRNTRGTTNEQNFVDFIFFHRSVLYDFL